MLLAFWLFMMLSAVTARAAVSHDVLIGDAMGLEKRCTGFCNGIICHNDPVNNFDYLGLEKRKILLNSGQALLIEKYGEAEAQRIILEHFDKVYDITPLTGGQGAEHAAVLSTEAREIWGFDRRMTLDDTMGVQVNFYLGGKVVLPFVEVYESEEPDTVLRAFPIFDTDLRGEKQLVGIYIFDNQGDVNAHAYGQSIIDSGRAQGFRTVFEMSTGAWTGPKFPKLSKDGLAAAEGTWAKLKRIVSGRRSTAINNGSGRVPNSVNDVLNRMVDRRYSINMNRAPTGTGSAPSATAGVNANGYPRNGPWFWRQLRDRNRNLFSPENIRKINRGEAPIVDKQWLQHFPSHSWTKRGYFSPPSFRPRASGRAAA